MPKFDFSNLSDDEIRCRKLHSNLCLHELRIEESKRRISEIRHHIVEIRDRMRDKEK
jgi:hypothetical protein